MPSTEEQRLDVIENCNILLNGILKPFKQTDDTPEGRMIAQLKWFKERAENHDLPLPVDDRYTSSLRYIYTDGELLRHASNNSRETQRDEIEIYLQHLMSLTTHGRLLLKPIYYPYAVRCINGFIHMLRHLARPLTQDEIASIPEFQQLSAQLAAGEITPPLGAVGHYEKISRMRFDLKEPPECKKLMWVVLRLIFQGVRPDDWLTPEAADAATRQWANL